MNRDKTAFRYFRTPYEFSTYSDAPQTCDLCDRARLGYRGPFYGSANVEFVCEECLITGKLTHKGLRTNEGDWAAIHDQLRALHPELDDAQTETLLRQRSAELEHRTPHPVTWQDFFWPAHCGDYCRFIKEAGQPDLNELAPDGDGRAFFGAHLYGNLGELTNVSDVWEDIRPDSPKDNAVAYHVGVYLFQCLHCKTYTILWDCD